jgi:hypothetical protein
MHRGLRGHYKVAAVGGEQVKGSVAHSLLPDPPLEPSRARQQLLERVTLALGRLDSVTLLLPNPKPVPLRLRATRSRALI